MRLSGVVLVVAVGVAHVGHELAHVHPAVAVEPDHRRADDVRLRNDELHAIAGGQDEGLRLLLRCSRRTGGLGEKSAPASVVDDSVPPPTPATPARALRRLTRRRGRGCSLRRRGLGGLRQHRRPNKGTMTTASLTSLPDTPAVLIPRFISVLRLTADHGNSRHYLNRHDLIRYTVDREFTDRGGDASRITVLRDTDCADRGLRGRERGRRDEGRVAMIEFLVRAIRIA